MMTLGRTPWLAFVLAALSPGCAGTGSSSLLSPPATVSSLKTNLSHMEYENRQLKSQLSRLDADNREIENELVQEKSANGELSARLDDARTLLSQRGLNGDNGLDLGTGAGKMLPAGQSNKKRRKPPFAQIPGRIDPVPADEDGDQTSSDPKSRDGLGAQSRNGGGGGGTLQWFPVADGSNDLVSPRR
jgi:hypothetical protein